MKVTYFILLTGFIFLSTSSNNRLGAQSRYQETFDTLMVKINEVEPINIYVETRFGKSIKVNSVIIKEDSLFFTAFDKKYAYHARNIVKIYFYKPNPYWKWVGAGIGIAVALGSLKLIDSYFQTGTYHFGATEYLIGATVGGVLCYMIGRGIDSEEIVIDF